jgi:hypothetical protein
MDIFAEFRKDSGIVYPPFSKIYFEKYFFNYMLQHPEFMDKYIPIFWTENQIPVLHKALAEKRQKAVGTLKKDTVYFTVVQHDDGITNTRLPKTVIFGMGGVGTIPLPLTYENTELFQKYKDVPKTIFCSFIGSLTHPCRLESVKQLREKPNVVIMTNPWSSNVSAENQTKFLEIMSQSRFSLAPRGYGKSSFRMYEALNMKSVPVYVYDEPWLPYKEILDWSKMAVLVHVKDIPTLYETLDAISDEEIANMHAYYEKYKHLFTYDGMCEYILKKFNELNVP